MFPDDTTVPDGFGIADAENSDATILASGGPFRRVKSKYGYSWMQAKVHLAGGSDVHEVSGDTAFAYAGGTGSTGIEVDAGCQHSPSYDNWAWYMKVGGGSPYTYTPRFRANQDVTLTFWVPQTGKVSLAVTGYDVDGVYRTMTYTHDASGWTTNGGNAMKKCTTIAQITEDFSSGSYHKNVHWYASKIGTSSSSNHTWSANDMPSTGGYTSYPDKTHVVVDPYVSAAEETVHIRLDL